MDFIGKYILYLVMIGLCFLAEYIAGRGIEVSLAIIIWFLIDNQN